MAKLKKYYDYEINRLCEAVMKSDEKLVDKLLADAVKRDCVIAGVSAGAIVLANSGFSDSYILRDESDKYEFVDGLKYIDINICPHYHSDDKKQKELEDSLKSNKIEEYGLENCTALKVIDSPFFKTIDV